MTILGSSAWMDQPT